MSSPSFLHDARVQQYVERASAANPPNTAKLFHRLNAKRLSARLRLMDKAIDDPDHVQERLRRDKMLRTQALHELLLVDALFHTSASSAQTSLAPPPSLAPPRTLGFDVLPSAAAWLHEAPRRVRSAWSTVDAGARRRLERFPARIKFHLAPEEPVPAAAKAGSADVNLNGDGSVLADGWDEAVDEETGRTYYYHTDGSTSWERPERPEPEAAKQPPTAAAPALEGLGDESAVTARENRVMQWRRRLRLREWGDNDSSNLRTRATAAAVFFLAASAALV